MILLYIFYSLRYFLLRIITEERRIDWNIWSPVQHYLLGDICEIKQIQNIIHQGSLIMMTEQNS